LDKDIGVGVDTSIQGKVDYGEVLCKRAYRDLSGYEVVGRIDLPDEVSIEDKLEVEIAEYWKATVNGAVDQILERLRHLYFNCYNGVTVPVGIITPAGVYRMDSERISKTKCGEINRIGNEMVKAFYGKDGVGSASGVEEYGITSSYALKLVTSETDNAWPKYNVLVKQGGTSFNFYWLHLRVMFGFKKYCKGIGVDGVVSGKVVKYEVIEGWAREYLTELLHRYFVENGITEDSDNDDINVIINTLIDGCSNIAVFLEAVKRDNKYTEVSILFGHSRATNKDCIVKLRKILKVEGVDNKSLDVLYSSANITKVRYLPDKEKANSGLLFAGDVLDGVIASKAVPSWSNVLLGKGLDGALLFWKDFANDNLEDRIILLYGGSGSGKGVMTNALLAGALAGGCSIFYMDGKPETGAGLGRIAWGEGKESAVFNGFHAGNAANFGDNKIESLSWGVRTVAETLGSVSKIPDELFSSEELETFLEVTRYIRALEVFCYVTENPRMSDEFKLIVFDEVEKFSNVENKVLKKFEILLSKEKISKDNMAGLLDMRAPIDVDPNLSQKAQFALKWLNWRVKLRGKVTTAITISLRQGKTSFLCIFQSSGWSKKYPQGIYGNILLNLSMGTKLIGRNALTEGNPKLGSTVARRAPWYTKLGEIEGSWAITKSGDVNNALESDVKVFKAFYTFITDNDSDVRDKMPISATRKHLARYLGDLYGGLGLDRTPGDDLNRGYEVYDSLISSQTGMSLKEFMYNAHSFGGDGDEFFDAEDVMQDGEELDLGVQESNEEVEVDDVLNDEEFDMDGWGDGGEDGSVSPDTGIDTPVDDSNEYKEDRPLYKSEGTSHGGDKVPYKSEGTSHGGDKGERVRDNYEPKIDIQDGVDNYHELDAYQSGYESAGMTQVESVPKEVAVPHNNPIIGFMNKVLGEASLASARPVLEQQSKLIQESIKGKLEYATAITLRGEEFFIGKELQITAPLVDVVAGQSLLYTLNIKDLIKNSRDLKQLTLDRDWADEFIDTYGLVHIAELFKRVSTLKAINVGLEKIRASEVDGILKQERAGTKQRRDIKRQYDESLYLRTTKAWNTSTGGQRIAVARMARWSADFTKSRQGRIGKVLTGAVLLGATAIVGSINLLWHVGRTGRNLRRQSDTTGG
jgi:hypothetical protein